MDCSRQEIFLGREAQKKLENSKVAIVGLGAIGSTTASLLARAGVRNLVLVDRDIIELNNLQRQSLFTEEDMEKPKVIVAKERLKEINSEINIVSHFQDLSYKNIEIIEADLVLDCTDNLDTRYLLNEFCKRYEIPFIYASAIKNKGYLFNVLQNGPCLKCILKNSKTSETCETSGVLNTITTLISSFQVNEAIKVITNNNPEKDLLFIDLGTDEITKIKVKKQKDCSVCNNKYEYLEGKKQDKIVRYCGSNSYAFYENFDFNKVKSNLKKLKIIDFGEAFKFENLTVFKNSVLIKADSEKKAKSLYSKYIGN